MSRVPHAPSSRPAVKTALFPPTTRSRAPSPSKPSTSAVLSPSTPRLRTKSIPKSPSKSVRRPPPEEEIPASKAALSIKDAIALKRAEAKKASVTSIVSGAGSSFDGFDNLEGVVPGGSPTKKEVDENIDLGRWSVQETIERARSTGSINLVSRSLPCLPSALFEIHLGVKPDALRSLPQEPPLASSEAPGRRPGQREGPAWFEAQDLQVLKAWNNEIVEIQHEISLFGSLKTVDLHQNRICALPHTFADLTALTTLDLSHNSLTSLPVNIFALPTLSNLNLSHNALVALPFGEPFSGQSRRSHQGTYSSGGFFGPVITRATAPLPRLLLLDVSFNKLIASAIDHTNLPSSLSKVDLSSNPIASGNSDSAALVRAFGGLTQLKELRFANADIGDDAFPPTLLGEKITRRFTSLRILDLEETRVNAGVVTAALTGLKQSLVFDITTDEPPAGALRITVGKKVLKEAWEIETEHRTRSRGRSTVNGGSTKASVDMSAREEPTKEVWEIEAEQGLLTEAGRRRARAAAAAAAAAESSATASTPSSEPKRNSFTGMGHPSSASSSSSSHFNLSNSQYYHAATQTLTLPPSAPTTRSHVRSFSLATPAFNNPASSGKSDIALPMPSLPIGAISAQSFAQTLKILILSNRKLDISISLPAFRNELDAGLIPTLEELILDGCSFGDSVLVTRPVEGSSTTPTKTNEPLLPLLTRLFPSLRTLDLSYNSLTSAALQKDILLALIMASPQDTARRPGLRHLRLRGNHITTLDGFQELAEIFKGNRTVPNWKLEELDLRDNEIPKLPAELGLLPLDVFLVDGNLFRIPQRRVWEREGTKGLLNWLRGRIE